ncbi:MULTISPECIES: hypothetical protein [Rhizobium/Agrobacterium group]|uniref:hypothetical protein n=1 Tax=Rhizobium/Agrobacterium group TaxID=227290 RepID=UPI0008DBF47D|nr:MULTISPECIES: hypothetical protein [Rhizobium/Agrobacterium group]OHZ30360.1 hypothetical protein BBL07_26010 [Agrobacterium vitis]UJL76579.1 hypothetical protein AVCG678_03110 [Agrobacterium vitis]UJL81790.1 hypothetical protein AVCG78_03110 [Agrobacterium vitis]
MDDFDISLYGCWPLPALSFACDRHGLTLNDGLEIKAADLTALSDHYAGLLNELTREMSAQFEQFRLLREGAAALMEGGDEAAAKLARADLKAATEAMSVIVRTLEKIDALQRQLVRDREAEEERAGETETLDVVQARLLALVETQAEAKAGLLFERWKAESLAATGPPGATSEQPIQTTA